MSDREQDVGPAAGSKHLARIDAAKRQRLLAKYLFSRDRSGADLGLVQGMWGRHQDGVDGGIAEHGVEIAGQCDAARDAKIARTLEVGFDRAEYLQPWIAV